MRLDTCSQKLSSPAALVVGEAEAATARLELFFQNAILFY